MKKFLLIAGIVIVVVIVITAVLLYTYKDEIAGFAAENVAGMMQSAVLENLPENVSEDSVKVIFNGVFEKYKSGEINAMQIQELLNAFQASQSDNKLDSLEVTSLMQSLEQLQK